MPGDRHVVGRIGAAHRRLLAVHEAMPDFCLERISAEDPCPSAIRLSGSTMTGERNPISLIPLSRALTCRSGCTFGLSSFARRAATGRYSSCSLNDLAIDKSVITDSPLCVKKHLSA